MQNNLISPGQTVPTGRPTSTNGIIIYCFMKLQKFGSKNYERRKREDLSKIEKNLMKMRCCVIPSCHRSDRRRLITKTFLAFSRTSKRRN